MEWVSLCESANCAKPAQVFGMKGTAKYRSCLEHVRSLLIKGMQIYDIEGYDFIGSHNDVAEFEERKTLVTQGRGNLTVLEASCESELIEVLQAIDTEKGKVVRTVEDRFEEMKAVVTGACKETMKQLEELRNHFKHFLLAKENQLSPAAQLLCADLTVTPRFLRFGVADVSDHISSVLSDSWVVSNTDAYSTLNCLDANQKKQAIETALAEASQYAKKGIQETLLYANLLIGEEEGFEQEKDAIIKELLTLEKLRIEESLNRLQNSWNLKQRYAVSATTTVRVGQQFARRLCYQLRQFAKAEEILQHCYDRATEQNPQSKESMSLCTDICGIYYASARYEELEQSGKWVLQTFAGAGHPAEYYWTVIFYLVDSMKLCGKNNEADAIFRSWREFRVGNKLGEMLRLLTFAVDASYAGSKTEKKKCLLQAWRIGIDYFPTSIFSASICSYLSTTCDDSSREKLLMQAQSIFAVSAPKSLYEAINLNRTGDLHKASQRWSAAEECYRQALSILATVAPRSIPTAQSLISMGSLLRESERWSEAVECFRQVQSIYEVVAPKSIAAADHLSSMGLLFASTESWGEAEQCYRQAQSLYEVLAPKSLSAAGNLKSLGYTFSDTERLSEAEDCYRQAQSIYEVVAPRSIPAADNLYCMGNLLSAKERWSEAEACYRQAQSILEVIAPKSLLAGYNLNGMGNLFKERERWSEAEECYTQARSIYEFVAPKSVPAASNLFLMGRMYEAIGRVTEAVECYQEAGIIYGINGKAEEKSLAEKGTARCRFRKL